MNKSAIITVKYFGKLTDITNCETEQLTIPLDENINSLKTCLLKKYIELKNEVYSIFINNKKAEDFGLALCNKDEICLMPPFSGG
jgi:molybdopterin converting factor small subunit